MEGGIKGSCAYTVTLWQNIWLCDRCWQETKKSYNLFVPATNVTAAQTSWPSSSRSFANLLPPPLWRINVYGSSTKARTLAGPQRLLWARGLMWISLCQPHDDLIVKIRKLTQRKGRELHAQRVCLASEPTFSPRDQGAACSHKTAKSTWGIERVLREGRGAALHTSLSSLYGTHKDVFIIIFYYKLSCLSCLLTLRPAL